ncbi:galactoside O-acetyltransferase [Orbus hercynius]|uniref:Chloramphenicol acetyltransferase n=1 Tax=Orbus hercynius TaxID=593135 RepID=A0A495RK71_9GAMM|nr:acyltransferase [Orbus hercynius]RKS87700.1 galactoside O-acetyltransferase [Orbus hercynius]
MNQLNSFYSISELSLLGFKSIGDNVLISRKVSIYQPDKISIGNNVRIDDFCVLSGNIYIGDYVHIACFCCLFAGDVGIDLNDFSGLSSRVSIYAVSDDYSGLFLTNPTIPTQYRNVFSKKVIISKHVIVGAGAIILPGVSLGEGTAVGAMSLVTKTFESWKIITGNPAKILKERKNKLLSLAANLEMEKDNGS